MRNLDKARLRVKNGDNTNTGQLLKLSMFDIYNKLDKTEANKDGIWISAANKEIQPLIDALENLYHEDLLKEDPLLSNERQIGLLNQAKEDMLRAKEAMDMMVEPDLIEIDIQAAHDHLKEILGEVHREDLLDTLFSKFCLGK